MFKINNGICATSLRVLLSLHNFFDVMGTGSCRIHLKRINRIAAILTQSIVRAAIDSRFDSDVTVFGATKNTSVMFTNDGLCMKSLAFGDTVLCCIS